MTDDEADVTCVDLGACDEADVTCVDLGTCDEADVTCVDLGPRDDRGPRHNLLRPRVKLTSG